MRGRNNGGNNNNNNRKGPNPLTRNYESNGPDVKIRGSAQQIAEKYGQLARDAHSAGDRVMAENYLQHAEHYNRIIAAAQAQMPIQNMQNMQAGRDMADDDMDDDRDDFDNVGNMGPGNGAADHQAAASNNGEPQQMNLGSAPQPVIEGTPAEVALNPEAAGDTNRRRDRHPVNGTEGDGDYRRGRRPRRGERHRQERPAEGTEDDGAVRASENTQEEPAADSGSVDSPLTPVEN